MAYKLHIAVFCLFFVILLDYSLNIKSFKPYFNLDALIPKDENKNVLPKGMISTGQIQVRMDVETANKYSQVEYLSGASDSLAMKVTDKNLIEYPTNSSQVATKLFRTIDELKKDFSSLSLSFTSEQSITEELLENIKNVSLPHNVRVSLIEDVTLLLHSIDNAKQFIKNNGLEILLSYLNIENLDNTCVPVMRALFAILQNNLQTQQYFNSIQGMEYIKNVLKQRLLNAVSPLCTQRTISAFSASLRGCDECCRNFFDGETEFLASLVELKDSNITAKILQMFVFLYHERKYDANTSTDGFKKFLNNQSFCRKRQQYFLFLNPASHSYLMNEAAKMYDEICDPHEL
ncbi:hypothetical protein HZS_4920 [Henneguya salminicola]|nr:hypothetical protein HZS_4920 [Henneguya salminicola]